MLPEPFGRRIVVADARLADRGDRVEHRVAGQVGVRIGAGVEQLRGQLEMGVRRPPAAAGSCPPAAAGRRSRVRVPRPVSSR